MKKLLLLFALCFIFSNVSAQSYSFYRSTDTLYYQTYFDSTQALKTSINTVRLRTINVSGIDTTMFFWHSAYNYSSFTAPKQVNTCDVTNYRSNLFGNRIFKKLASNTETIITEWNDSIVYPRNMPMNQEWLMSRLGNDTLVYAKIVSLNAYPISGLINDSVKTIVLTVKNGLGNGITHHLNNKRIVVSRLQGIVESQVILGYIRFGTMHKMSLVASKPAFQPNVPPTCENVFNYAVGDEFHFEENITPGEIDYHAYTVLAKSLITNGFNYRLDHQHLKMQILGGGNFSFISFNRDTLNNDYNCQSPIYRRLNFSGFIWENAAGDRNGDYTSYFKNQAKYNGRLQALMEPYRVDTMATLDTTCWIIDGNISYSYTFANGLGLIKEDYHNGITNELIFFKKGSETWGNKVRFWLYNSATTTQNSSLKLYPNPVTDVLNIEFKTELQTNKTKLEVIDQNGRLISLEMKSLNSNVLQLNTQLLPKGIYTIRLVSEKEVLISKFVK